MQANSISETNNNGNVPISNFQAHAADLHLDQPVGARSIENDAHMDTQSIYSMVSDEAASTVSKLDLLDRELPMIIKESKHHPGVLVGWKISVRDRGVGMVTAAVRKWGSTTQYTVQFEDGKVETLALQRGSKKGSVPFIPISKDH